MRVFLAGEGPNELGSFFREALYRETKFPGVIEALLRKVQPEGWQAHDGMTWKSIPKLTVGEHGRAEVRNIGALVLHAREKKCQVIAFVRDRDGVKQREKDVEEGIAKAKAAYADGPEIVGGVAIERLESWLVALSGKTKSESLRGPEKLLAKLGIKGKDTSAMVALVEKANLKKMPPDARSLKKWLEQANTVLV